MQRIVYVWNYRDWGGAQLYFASLLSTTAESFAVEAALPEGSAPRVLERFQAGGAEIFQLNGQTDLISESGLLNKFVRHYKKLKAEGQLYKQLSYRYDPVETALHVDIGFWSSLILLVRLSRRFHVFYTVHTPLDPKSKIRHMLWKLKGSIAGRRKTFHFLASNAAAKRSLEPFLPKGSAVQVQVAYTGFESSEIELATVGRSERRSIRQGIGVAEDKFLIVLVGQFITRKGAHVLIDALPEIFNAVPHAQIVWLTMREPEGPLADRLEVAIRSFPFRLVLEAEAGGRLGVLRALGSADLFALPSLDEGLPGALLEAMALGVPCVASKVGAVAEAIEDGKSGLLVRAGDPIDLARRIIEMEADPERRKVMASNAKEVAFKKFDAKGAAAVTVGEYKKHLAPTDRVPEPVTSNE